MEKWRTRGFPEKSEKILEVEYSGDLSGPRFPENLQKRLQTESSRKSRSRVYPVKRNVTWEKSRKSESRFLFQRDKVNVRLPSSTGSSETEVESSYREAAVCKKSSFGKREAYQGHESPCEYKIRGVERQRLSCKKVG